MSKPNVFFQIVILGNNLDVIHNRGFNPSIRKQMKKIMLLMVLLSAVAMAGVKPLATSVLLVVAGALFFPGLVVGDAQWQGYTNRGVCDSSHTIYSTAPQLKDGVLGKIAFAVPCSEWYEYNRGEK